MRSHRFRIVALATLVLLAFLHPLPHGGAAAQPAGATYTGFLSVLWGGGSSLQAELTLPDGTTHPLKIDGAQQGLVQQLSGKRVQIRGRMTDGAAPATIVVDTIAPAAPARGK